MSNVSDELTFVRQASRALAWARDAEKTLETLKTAQDSLDRLLAEKAVLVASLSALRDEQGAVLASVKDLHVKEREAVLAHDAADDIYRKKVNDLAADYEKRVYDFEASTKAAKDALDEQLGQFQRDADNRKTLINEEIALLEEKRDAIVSEIETLKSKWA